MVEVSFSVVVGLVVVVGTVVVVVVVVDDSSAVSSTVVSVVVVSPYNICASSRPASSKRTGVEGGKFSMTSVEKPLVRFTY